MKWKTVDEYIDSQDEQVRSVLQEMRRIISSALPDAEECISWSMPTYRKGRNIIHFAAFKNHIGLYPGGEAVTKFASELSGYSVSKGTVRFSYDEKLPEELIRKIALWCRMKYGQSND